MIEHPAFTIEEWKIRETELHRDIWRRRSPFSPFPMAT